MFTLYQKNPWIIIAELSYLLALYVSYIGAKMLDMSVYSPLEGLDSAATILMFLPYFYAVGDSVRIHKLLSPSNILGLFLSIFGAAALAVLQNRYAKRDALDPAIDPKKKHYPAWALLFPILFCVFDGTSSFIEGVALTSDSTGSIGAFDYLRIIASIVVIYGTIAWLILYKRTGEQFIPFRKGGRPYIAISVFDTISSIFYPFAMEAALIPSVIAFNSYSVITILISRIVLKERLTKMQYLFIAVTLLGVILITLADLAAG